MSNEKNATPPEELERQIMSSLVTKNEREHWACGEIESLRQQLGAALAACKQKNKALLEYAMGDKTKYYVDPEGTIEAKPADAIALAIQPDNSALKAFADTKEN